MEEVLFSGLIKFFYQMNFISSLLQVNNIITIT